MYVTTSRRGEEKRREENIHDLDPTDRTTAHLDVLVEHVHPDLPTICRSHVLGEQSAGHASFHVVHSQQYHALIHLRSNKKTSRQTRAGRRETGDGRKTDKNRSIGPSHQSVRVSHTDSAFVVCTCTSMYMYMLLCRTTCFWCIYIL